MKQPNPFFSDEFDKTTVAHLKELGKEDWQSLEEDVLLRFRALRALVEKLDLNDVNMIVLRDAVVPALALLARFVASIEILDEEKATCVLKYQPPRNPSQKHSNN